MPKARAKQKMQNLRSVYAVYLTFEWEVSWGLGPRRVFEGSPERLQGSRGPPCLTLRCRFLASCIRKNSSLATLSFAPGQILLQLKKVTPSALGITSLNCQLLLREGRGLRNPFPICARLQKSTILSSSPMDSHCGRELMSGWPAMSAVSQRTSPLSSSDNISTSSFHSLLI